MSKRTIFLWLPFFISFIAIILTANFAASELSFFDQKKVVQSVVLLISSVFFSVFFLRHKITGFNNAILSSFGIFLVLLIISSILAPLSGWAFLQVGWYILVLQLLVYNSYLYQQKPGFYIKATLIGVIVLCCLYISRVFADYLTGMLADNWTTWPQQRSIQYYYKGKLLNPNGFLNFIHVRFFNHIQTWTLPILVLGYLYFKKSLIPGLQYLLLFFVSSWWMLVFASGARGTMVASLASMFLVGLFYRKKAFNFVKVYGFTTLSGLVLYWLLFFTPKPEAREVMTRFTSTGRIDVWKFSIEKIIENPFWGLGPMHFSYMGIDPIWSTPHNLILQSAGEWGIPAVLTAISLSLLGLYKFFVQSLKIKEKVNESQQYIRISLLTAIVSALIHSMVSGVFNSQLSQLLFTILGGWMLGAYFMQDQKSFFLKRAKNTFVVYLVLLLISANTIFIGYHAFTAIPELNQRKKEFLVKYKIYTYYPRFWNQGMIYESIGKD